MTSFNLLIGFLILFLLYQLAEANGQDLLKFPGKPYSIFLMFLLIIPVVGMVASWQGGSALESYGMGFHVGWWQNYLLGVGLGLILQSALELIGVRFDIRKISNIHFSWHTLFIGILWALITNFPAAASEDLITRGYIWMFMKTSPLLVFMLFSTLIYTFNHIIRLFTRPITDWYHLPFLGLTLAYALFQTGSLWFVIGLHQSGNVILYLMQQMMDVTNITDTRKRITFGVASELIMLMIVILLSHLPNLYIQ